MKNFENPKNGQNRLFSVKKVDFWPPKVDFRHFFDFSKISIFRRCRPRQKEFLRFWPFFRGQCAKTVGRIGASLGSFWSARKTLQNEPKIVKNGFLVFAQWGSRKPDFHFFKKTRFSALFFRGPNRPKSAQNGLFGPKFCDFRLFREILAILGEFGENRFFRFLADLGPAGPISPKCTFRKMARARSKKVRLQKYFFWVEPTSPKTRILKPNCKSIFSGA